MEPLIHLLKEVEYDDDDNVKSIHLSCGHTPVKHVPALFTGVIDSVTCMSCLNAQREAIDWRVKELSLKQYMDTHPILRSVN